MAISLLVSFTYGWSTDTSLAIMVGIYCGVVYGGSRSAILLNIPGAPAAVATALDGYPLMNAAPYVVGLLLFALLPLLLLRRLKKMLLIVPYIP